VDVDVLVGEDEAEDHIAELARKAQEGDCVSLRAMLSWWSAYGSRRLTKTT
jgi:hypothetical protein